MLVGLGQATVLADLLNCQGQQEQSPVLDQQV